MTQAKIDLTKCIVNQTLTENMIIVVSKYLNKIWFGFSPSPLFTKRPAASLTFYIINKPGVADAVLQTPLKLNDSFIQ